MSGAAARIAAISERDRAAAAPEPTPVPQPPARSRVRQTVDLEPDAYAELSAWCVTAAPMIGRTRSVSKQEVLSTLVALLLEDDALARRVRARLADSASR